MAILEKIHHSQAVDLAVLLGMYMRVANYGAPLLAKLLGDLMEEINSRAQQIQNSSDDVAPVEQKNFAEKVLDLIDGRIQYRNLNQVVFSIVENALGTEAARQVILSRFTVLTDYLLENNYLFSDNTRASNISQAFRQKH